jgi:precorrin-2 dehydrogenase/sirohydrochlorin ferrochelatase
MNNSKFKIQNSKRCYPVNLDIRNRKCLVVGGGAVATRKVKTLSDFDAVVTVVSPQFSEELMRMANNEIVLKKRPYRTSDLEGKFLVIGATDDKAINRQVNADAEKQNMLCNIADQPHLCNFILPAIVNRGDLLIAISTSGQSPAFAKKLRKELESQFGEEYGLLLNLMGAIRTKLLSAAHEPEAHKPLFEKLLDAGLLAMIKEKRYDDIDALLYEVLGQGYDLASIN